MSISEMLAARRLYELERRQQERTFAGDHTFEEWLAWISGR